MMIEILKPATIVFGTFVLLAAIYAVCVYATRDKNHD